MIDEIYNHLFYMIIYDSVSEIDAPYIELELRRGVFPGIVGEDFYRGKTSIQAADILPSNSIIRDEFWKLCNAAIKEIRTRYNSTFVFLISISPRNWELEIQLHASEIINADIAMADFIPV